MNQFHYNQSLKDIPIPSKSQYQRTLVSKIEKFIGNLRWKLYHIQNPSHKNTKECYGFKSTKHPPRMKELTALEEDLIKLAKNIEFKKVNNVFQDRLKEQIRTIKQTPDIIVKADKSNNLYNIAVDDFEKLLKENITSEYRKYDKDIVTSINKESAKIAKSLDLDDRIDIHTESEAFLTIKDHKPNFPGRVQCRLINPAKSNIGKISKTILEKAIRKTVSDTKYNQWRNSSQVISWFNDLPSKEKLSFIKFDIVSFYPSISQDLFNKALCWAKTYYNFSTQELDIIEIARKSFLFSKDTVWSKKNSHDFDITMGSYDGAECCELVGLYILDKIKNTISYEYVGLYRDDGLAAIQGSGPFVEAKRKQICNLFKDLGLKVTTESNLKQTDFLDISLNLETSIYKPYRKDNSLPTYINSMSNHPRNIKRNLPQMISDRIANLSSSKQIYDDEIKPYKESLLSVGYKQQLAYNRQGPKKKKRQRKIIWFNPPFSETVKTNIGAQFLKLIDKHFKGSVLEQYFNRKTIKVSYSCMPNVGKIIMNHNKKILNMKDTKNETNRKCNCSEGIQACPLKGQCLQRSIVYKAEVATNNNKQCYIGQAGNSFKERYSNHNYTFNHKIHENSTKLSKYLWYLTENQIEYELNWYKIASAPTYTPSAGKCSLCTLEKTFILFSNEKLLNSRNEILNKCRHRNKYLLKAVT